MSAVEYKETPIWAFTRPDGHKTDSRGYRQSLPCSGWSSGKRRACYRATFSSQKGCRESVPVLQGFSPAPDGFRDGILVLPAGLAMRSAGQSAQVSLIRGGAGGPTVGRMPEFLAGTCAPR